MLLNRARSATALSAICAVLCLITPVSSAQFTFVESNAAAKIGAYVIDSGKGGGVCAADFDDDGDIDLFVPNGEGVPDQLYRNMGNGEFEEIAAQAGLDTLDHGRVALWFDYDGDHRLDLVVAGDCFQRFDACEPNLRLYRQVSEAVFEDVTVQSRLLEGLEFPSPSTHLGGFSAGDINNDGYLDLLLAQWAGRSPFYLNLGDGTFANITDSSGINPGFMRHYQHVMHDFNGDGWLDIYTAFDGGPNKFWINQHDNTFEDVSAEVGTTAGVNGMGISLGDYDNDGDFDIYLTNIRFNQLFRDDSADGILQYKAVAGEAGVTSVGWAWGCTFFDADNDGYLDLGVTNGWRTPPWITDQSKFFRNTGDAVAVFEDVSDAVGFNDSRIGCALISWDYDRDGYLDMLQSTISTVAGGSALRLLHNEPAAKGENSNYFVVRPRLPGTNHYAIGTVVHVVAGDKTMMRLITAGTGFQGQEPAEAHFGLGSAEQVDTLLIEWPDGTQSEWENIPANQMVTAGPDFIDGEGIGGSGCAAGSISPSEPLSDPGTLIFLIAAGLLIHLIPMLKSRKNSGA